MRPCRGHLFDGALVLPASRPERPSSHLRAIYQHFGNFLAFADATREADGKQRAPLVEAKRQQPVASGFPVKAAFRPGWAPPDAVFRPRRNGPGPRHDKGSSGILQTQHKWLIDDLFWMPQSCRRFFAKGRCRAEMWHKPDGIESRSCRCPDSVPRERTVGSPPADCDERWGQMPSSIDTKSPNL